MFVWNSALWQGQIAPSRGLQASSRTESRLRFRPSLFAMLNAAAISLSGMNAARTTMDVSAHNIANLGTRDFLRQQVVQTASAGGGVTTSVAQAPAAGNALEADFVGQLMAKNTFLANWAVFRTSNKMLGSLLDEQG